MALETVTVYASSSNRVDASFKKAGFELGAAIAREGWTQVNGGGSTGLMCSATDGGLSEGGRVKVVILKHFLERGYLHKGVDEVIVEENMPGRKKGLYDLGDAYIALPGGLGTFEEIMEVLSWRQLGFHNKAIAVLNVKGYYDAMKALLDHSIQEQFVAPGFDKTYLFSDSVDQIIAWLKTYEAKPFTIDSKV